MSFGGKNFSFRLTTDDKQWTDLSRYIREYTISFNEPANPADCPHAPGTPEHSQWIKDNVTSRQRSGTQAHAEAKAIADQRLAKLRNAWGARRQEPTYAYGKTVDDLLDFIENGDRPIMADYVSAKFWSQPIEELERTLRLKKERGR